jgi:zinc protease
MVRLAFLSRSGRTLAAGLLIGGLAAATTARAAMFNPETFTLKNGMQVVVVTNHRAPVVCQIVVYKVGSADETPGKTGLAHMVEHMMFNGTKTVPAGQFSHLVANAGGRENAFTTADYTAFYQNVALDKLPLVMKLEADRMANLAPLDADFQNERQVVLEERRMRVENDPAALMEEQVEADLFLASEYHHPVIGWHQDIDGFSLTDVTQFYRRWYAPNNAILVVAGDITAAQLKPLAERTYGAVPRRATPERTRTGEPPPVAERHLEVRSADVHEPTWSRSYLAPSRHAGTVEDSYPLEVLEEILGGGATSRLYRTVVVERALAVSVSTDYDGGALGPAVFAIEANPSSGVAMAALDAALTEALGRVATDGVTDEEVSRAKQRLQASVAYARDSVVAGARTLARDLAEGDAVADVEAWPERIASVTTEQVNQAARRLLKDERSVTAVLLPAAPGRETVAIEAAGHGAVAIPGKEVR